MINTELHNKLIEQEVQRKIIESEIRITKAQREILKERLVQTLLIAGVVFIIVLLLIFLYWIFPNKSFNNISNMKQIEQLIKENNCFPDDNSTKKLEIQKPIEKNLVEILKKGSLKNGTEYIKKDNYVFERTWKDGLLVKELRLQATIKDSEIASTKKIPTFSKPVK